MKQNYSVNDNLLIDILEKYIKSGRIGNTYVDEFKKNLMAQNLRIGVIGKMKAGKSSLVNALIFKKAVLPTGLKPMTVTLTEIAYGETNMVEVELLTTADLDQLKERLNDSDPLKVKAAREVFDQLKTMEGGYEQYLSEGNNKVTIKLDELADYVAVGGKLSGMAKIVRVFINDKNLQGITIVDTPGFNDPILSRGETTRNHLSTCHILLFVHSIQDTYDSEEICLVREQVAYDGISELIDVVNKIDLLDTDEYPISQWQLFVNNFIKQRKVAVSQMHNDDLEQMLLSAKCLHASPYMALIGLADPLIGDFANDYLDYRTESPELTSQEDFVTYSNLPKLVEVINQVTKEKDKYLMEGPSKKLAGKLDAIKVTVDGEIQERINKLSTLQLSQEAILQKLESFNKQVDAISHYICDADLTVQLTKKISDSRCNLQKERGIVVKDELTDDIFKDPAFLGKGRNKQNNSSFNILLTSMCDKIRNELYNLKANFESIADAHVDKTLAKLITDSFSKENRDELDLALRNTLKQLIVNISTNVETIQISKTPEGNLKASALYRKVFESSFSDDVLDKYLNPFTTEVSHIMDNYREKAFERIQKIAAEIKSASKFNPAAKEKEKVELERQLDSLNAEREQIEKDLVQLKK